MLYDGTKKARRRMIILFWPIMEHTRHRHARQPRPDQSQSPTLPRAKRHPDMRQTTQPHKIRVYTESKAPIPVQPNSPPYNQNSAAANAPAPTAPWTCGPIGAPAVLEAAALADDRLAVAELARLVRTVVPVPERVGLEKVVLPGRAVPVPADEGAVTRGTVVIRLALAVVVAFSTGPESVEMAAVVEPATERMVAVPEVVTLAEPPPVSENRPEKLSWPTPCEMDSA